MRLPINQRHFEHDAAPFELLRAGFERLDGAIRACADAGLYSVIDLHAVPGCQNQHWHSDNPTHVAAFWQHPHFQDRVVHLWRALAERYRDEPAVAGYNLLNEPADPSGQVVGPFHDRLVAAVREVDPDHIVFVDGNTYSTDFSAFARAVPERDLRLPRLRPRRDGLRRPVPGRDGGPLGRPRRARGDVPRAHRVHARDRHADLGRRVRPGLHRRSRARRACATRCSPTSSRSTSATAPAGRCGPTRTSACRASSRVRPDSAVPARASAT